MNKKFLLLVFTGIKPTKAHCWVLLTGVVATSSATVSVKMQQCLNRCYRRGKKNHSVTCFNLTVVYLYYYKPLKMLEF